MRKVFLMLTTTLFSLEANAACSPTPECASLGYKYSLEECGGAAIKCPNGDGYYCPSLRKCNIGDIYYSDKTCSSADNYDSSKTVLGIVVYVTDGGKHGQIIAPWWVDENGNASNNNTGMFWASESFWKIDVLGLPNYTLLSSAKADYDSCGNTDKIVTAGDASAYPAAWATRKYAPTPETTGKWCLPAAGILNDVYNNPTLFDIIKKIGGVDYGIYFVWSSSENSNDDALYYNYSQNHNLSISGKLSSFAVQPVLEF